jgi:hypothetical protein
LLILLPLFHLHPGPDPSDERHLPHRVTAPEPVLVPALATLPPLSLLLLEKAIAYGSLTVTQDDSGCFAGNQTPGTQSSAAWTLDDAAASRAPPSLLA